MYNYFNTKGKCYFVVVDSPFLVHFRIRKIVSLIIISFVSLLIFAFNGLINWEIGLVMSVGSFFGGYWGSKIAHLENVKKWIYRILIGIIVFEIIKLGIELFIR